MKHIELNGPWYTPDGKSFPTYEKARSYWNECILLRS